MWRVVRLTQMDPFDVFSLHCVNNPCNKIMLLFATEKLIFSRWRILLFFSTPAQKPHRWAAIRKTRFNPANSTFLYIKCGRPGPSPHRHANAMYDLTAVVFFFFFIQLPSVEQRVVATPGTDFTLKISKDQICCHNRYVCLVSWSG